MPKFEPIIFLDFAKNLVSNHPSEVQYRIAIGRSYYALFLIARDRLGVTATSNVHSAVGREVKKRPGHRGTSYKLKSLSRLRVVADYQVVPVNAYDLDWENNWKRAEKIVDDILPKIQSI